MARRSRKKSGLTLKGCGTLLMAAILLGFAVSYPDLAKAALVLAGVVILAGVWKKSRGSARRIARDADLEQIYALTPQQFEDFTHGLLADLGYNGLRRTGGAGDLGVDIVGRDPEGRSIAVQCKRYMPGQRIGSKSIQTFIGMQKIHHGAEKGIFVTTASYTVAASDLAADHDIWLIDGTALVHLNRMRMKEAGGKRFRLS